MKKIPLSLGICIFLIHVPLIAQDVADPNAEQIEDIPIPRINGDVVEVPTDNQDPGTLATEAAATVSETKRDVLFEKVDDLRRKFVESRSEQTTKAIRRLAEALVDDEATFDLYIEAVRYLDFEVADRPAIDFIEWRKENIAFLRSRENKQALRLQLLHLVAALRAGLADDVRDAFPAVNRWIQYYIEVEGSLTYPRTENRREGARVKRVIGAGLFGTYFARYFELERVVKVPAGWPTSCTNVDSFFSKVLLPICREAGDWPGIDKAWQVRLSAVRSIGRDREERQDKVAWEAVMKRFYPDLLWERAVDKIAFGPDPEIGLKEAYSVIFTYFDHPEMPRWIEQFTLMVRPPDPEEGAGANNETLASLLSSLRPPEPPSVLKEDEETEEADEETPTPEDTEN